MTAILQRQPDPWDLFSDEGVLHSQSDIHGGPVGWEPFTPKPTNPPYGDVPKVPSSPVNYARGSSLYQLPSDVGVVGDYGMDYEGIIGDYLKGVLSGKSTRWSPEAVTAAKSEAKSAAEGSARSQREQAQFDLARTGMSESGIANRTYADIGRAAGQQYGHAVTQIIIQKANADFEDKMTALTQMRGFLNEVRAFKLSQASTSLERARIQANLSIAYANIDQAEKQLQQQWAMFQQQMGLQWSQFDFTKQMNLIPIQLPDGSTIYVPITALGQLGMA